MTGFSIGAAFSRLVAETEAAIVLTRSGLVRPVRPDKLIGMLAGVARFGVTMAAAATAAAARNPSRTAIVDDEGSLTYRELLDAARSAAHGLRGVGLHEGDRLALLAPNGRLPVITVIAAGLLGVDSLLLNTGLSAAQVAELCRREKVSVLVIDPGLADAAAEVATSTRVVEDLTALAPAEHGRLPIRPHPGRIIIMTSGTTGAPKGARRKDPSSLVPPAALISRIPLREAGATVIAAPLFHTWGFANLELGVVLGSTLIIRRKVQPLQVLSDIADYGADALVTVPIIVSRLLDVPESDRPPTPTLRIASLSGSALPGPLATRFQDAFGDVLYNLYGSTEVSWVSIATPEDLRADPSTAGKPPLGTRVSLLDEAGVSVQPGEVGRIFVGNDLLFDGYTGTEKGPEVIDGMLATGDLGRFDEAGRLTVLGRSDGMIVSGGENVFASEVENLLAGCEGVLEVAVLGVPDEQFGQRLAAVIVAKPGADLDAEQVKALVRRDLARFSVPRDVVFVDELPRNATGKVVNAKVRELLVR